MYTNLFTLLTLASAVQAHMHLEYPPPLKGDTNKFTQGKPDVFYNYPYGCCGKKFDMGPCRGHHKLLNTDEGQPVATWKAGETVQFSLSGQKIKGTGPEFTDPETNVLGGSHSGGSCQAGFSFDGGKTFQTVATWQGNCPHREGGITPETQKFDIKLPEFLPSTERALFAWTWVNREQEFFMNCASVTIEGGSGQAPSPPSPSGQPSASSSPSGRPAPSASPSPSGRPAPSSTRGASRPNPTQKPSSQYKLEGCTCECPSQTFSQRCNCVCDSVETKRHIVARRALALHKSSLRRAAATLKDLPPMQLGFVNGCPASSFPPKSANIELEFSNPGDLNVVKDAGKGYKLQESTCQNAVSFALP